MSARLRPVLALGLMVAVASAGVASAAGKTAAAKPVCNLVTDPTGDSSVYPAGGVQEDAMDITSVDLATDKTSVTGVIRIKKLSASSTNAPTGMNWTVNFTADGTVFSLAGHATVAGTVVFDTAYASTTGGSLYGPGTTGVFDTAKNEVRITAPLSLLSAQADIRSGKTKITDINGRTGGEILVPDPSGTFGPTILSDSEFDADTTASGPAYLAGTPSCVVVGK
ncbi:MAG: hypothetical protein QOI82_1315 [Actinomycetota bacterium]|nr:hypothetical protein [Actinomycetota bacterium]